MKYQAIIFDLDGTVVPSTQNGMPSPAVIAATQKLNGKLKLSTASARAVQYCRDIWKALSIKDPCIINGGSQIIDPQTEKILWEQTLPDGAIKEVLKKSLQFTDSFAINGVMLNGRKDLDNFPASGNLLVAFGVPNEEVDTMVGILSTIPGVTVHILYSWIGENFKDIHVIHKSATKKHAIEKLIEIMGVKKEAVIGMGDGYNDLPLFESVGLKVAMGNAVEELKQAADLVTETLDNDGFAKFIEKKLLT